MRKYLRVFGVILACALGALAQEKQQHVKVQNKPDLTGSWLLDRGRSNVGQSAKRDLPLKISYREPELTIKRQFDHSGQIVERDFTYYTDGRGETNQAAMALSDGTNMNSRDLDKQVTRSRTRWSGNKLVTRSTLSNPIAGRILEFEVTEEWKLSEDGRALTQTSRTVFRPGSSDPVFIPANVPDSKRVYSRVPD
ncbi:MAG: hypothetical protein M3R69_17180 [Acidobacteriota bacterium]|nr:hypothetical protein [Acidobacteriota bacterium]